MTRRERDANLPIVEGLDHEVFPIDGEDVRRAVWDGGIVDEIERKLHIVGSKGAAVGPAEAVAEREGVGEAVVGDIP